MKLFIYFLLSLTFAGTASAVASDVPPVLELYRQETLATVNKGLQKHLKTKDYTVSFQIKANKSAKFVGEGLEIKEVNGEIPKTGLYLPRVKDVLGETKYLLGKVSLKVKINKELDEEKAVAIKEQLAKWAKINPAKGDILTFDYRLKPTVAVQLPEQNLTEEIVAEPLLTGLPTKEIVLSLLAALLLIWGIKRAIITQPKTAETQEIDMTLVEQMQSEIENDELFDNLEDLEEIDLEAEVDLNTNFDLGMDLELNTDLDQVIQDAEAAIFASEQELSKEVSFTEILNETTKQQSQFDFSFLAESSLEQLQILIAKETPVVRALIVNQLPLAQGEELYQLLNEKEQFSIVCEISNLANLSDEALLGLSLELEAKLNKTKKTGLTLAASQSKAKRQVTGNFTFEMIAQLPFKFITDLVNRLVLVDLGIALSHAPKDVREKMLLCLDSQRRKEFIRSASQIRANEFESFTKQELILEIASSLAEAGASDLQKIAQG